MISRCRLFCRRVCCADFYGCQLTLTMRVRYDTHSSLPTMVLTNRFKGSGIRLSQLRWGAPLLYVLAMNLRPALDVTFIEAHRRVRPVVTFRMHRLHPRHAPAAQLTANSPCRPIYTSVQCIACERGLLHVGNGTADIEGLGRNRCGKLVRLCERSRYRAYRGLARTPVEKRKSQYDSSCAQWQGMLRDLRARQQ